jgi:uncharacterized membrane protein
MERRTAVIAASAALVAATGTVAGYMLTRQERPKVARIKRAITVRADADTLLGMWRDPRHLQTMIGDIAEIDRSAGDALQWAIPSLGVAWTTRVVEERPGSMLRFESAPGDPVHMEATVLTRPAPADWGTELHLEYVLDMPPPLRKLTELMGSLFSISLVHRLKSLAETGVVPTLAHNPAGRAGGHDR